jgi:glycine/D-amino acid oxidase-like deaminating enzyme
VKTAGKVIMYLRICAASFVATLALNQAAQAQTSLQVRAAIHPDDPRADFVRQCAPHMLGRWAHPEEVCGCLHDHAAAVVEDKDLRQALLRGISETGVPTIENDWVPASKRSEIGPTFTKIAKPTLQCMFDPAK